MELKHSTFELYVLDPCQFELLPYREALELKIWGAGQAMDQYRNLARRVINRDNEKYDKYMKSYLASEKAREFNRALLRELDE